MFNTVSRIAIASATLAASATGALALEAEDFADKLIALGQVQGIAFDYGSATAEGDTITLSGFTVIMPGDDKDVEVPGDVVFEGVVETGDGGYTAERASIADVSYTDDEEDITLDLTNIAAEGLEIPASVDIDSILDAGFDLYDRISAGPLTVSDADGSELFGVESMEIWVEAVEDGGMRSGYAVDGISADLSVIEEAEAQEVITAFGVEQFSASMSGAGTWWPDTGRVEVEDIDLVIDDLATLSMDFAIEGYTREIYEELIKSNIKMAELAQSGEEISDEQMEAMSMDMLADMDTVALASASVRYDDSSLFMKVLDFIGQEQGVDGATFAQGLQFMVPMMMVEVENEAFKTMVTSAVNTFIEDPQNFTVSVAPQEPIAFSAFADMQAEVEADPFVLVDRLGVEVTANQ